MFYTGSRTTCLNLDEIYFWFQQWSADFVKKIQQVFCINFFCSWSMLIFRQENEFRTGLSSNLVPWIDRFGRNCLYMLNTYFFTVDSADRPLTLFKCRKELSLSLRRKKIILSLWSKKWVFSILQARERVVQDAGQTAKLCSRSGDWKGGCPLCKRGELSLDFTFFLNSQ